jgi:hypothetical protein
MRWEEFARAATELAKLGEERFERAGLCLVGTLRRDGWPRISPVEPYVARGELLLGMIWQSYKARDLLRDPRVVIHSVVSDRHGSEGDFKLYGQTLNVEEPEVRESYADATEARIDWRPTEPYHLFSVDIESAGFIIAAPEHYGLRWNPREGSVRFSLPWA